MRRILTASFLFGIVIICLPFLPFQKSDAFYTGVPIGIPSPPTDVMGAEGTHVGGVNLYTGHNRMSIPLMELLGRGSATFSLSLRYNSDVHDLANSDNDEIQASWVGAGWEIEIPYVFGLLEANIDGSNQITSVDTKHILYWNGVADSLYEDGSNLRLTHKGWKVEYTTDSNGYIQKFLIWDANGTEYEFAHRRMTDIGVFTDQYVSWSGDVPYRWDLTRIEDVTGESSISFYHKNYTANVPAGHEYTRSAHIDSIKDNSSGQVMRFTVGSRTDYPSPNDWRYFYSTKKLEKIELVDPSKNIINRVVLSDTTYSCEEDKLALLSVQRVNPSGSGYDFPSTKFSYWSPTNNKLQLKTVTVAVPSD